MSEFRDDPTGQVKQARHPQSKNAAEISIDSQQTTGLRTGSSCACLVAVTRAIVPPVRSCVNIAATEPARRVGGIAQQCLR
jgi:hypothetical protein